MSPPEEGRLYPRIPEASVRVGIVFEPKAGATLRMAAMDALGLLHLMPHTDSALFIFNDTPVRLTKTMTSVDVCDAYDRERGTVPR